MLPKSRTIPESNPEHGESTEHGVLQDRSRFRLGKITRLAQERSGRFLLAASGFFRTCP